jgi:hypothetical protein
VLEPLPLILREEYGLTFPKNKALRNVLGPQREETTRDWRKVHSEKLNDFILLNKYHVREQI